MATTRDLLSGHGSAQGAQARQIITLLLTLKLASLIFVGVLLSAAGVIAGHAVAAMATQSGLEMDAALAMPARVLSRTPAWGVLAGVPAIACGIVGLVWRRRAWIWATLGTIALAGTVIALGVLVFGSLASLASFEDRLLR